MQNVNSPNHEVLELVVVIGSNSSNGPSRWFEISASFNAVHPSVFTGDGLRVVNFESRRAAIRFLLFRE